MQPFISNRHHSSKRQTHYFLSYLVLFSIERLFSGQQASTLRLRVSFLMTCTRENEREVIGWMRRWIFFFFGVRISFLEHLRGNMIPSPSCSFCGLRPDRTPLPCSQRDSWESISSFLQMRGGLWCRFDRPRVVGSGKRKGVQGWNIENALIYV